MSRITDEEELGIRKRLYNRRTLKRQLGQDALSLIFDREARKAENARLRSALERILTVGWSGFDPGRSEEIMRMARQALEGEGESGCRLREREP